MLVRKYYKVCENDFDVESKEDNSPLTLADKKLNETIVKVISKYP